jgi:hypothetical protein
MKAKRTIALTRTIILALALCVSFIPPASAAEQPSSWAAEQVNGAIELGIVPQSLRSGYTQTITRAEYCALAVALYEKYTGVEIAERMTFSDTDDVSVEKMAAVGVVTGMGNNLFAPDAKLTREQAATMLARLADAIGKPLERKAASFADNAAISMWAIKSVGQVQGANIMSGIGSNTFAPKDPYTREQSILTMGRLWDGAQRGDGETPESALPSANEYGNTPGNINNGGLAAIQGNKMFYVNNDLNIYCINVDVSNKRKLNDDRSFSINVVGDRIFYVSFDGDYDYSIYSMNTDGSDRKKLSDDEAYIISVVGDTIFYINEDDDSSIYSIRTDGSDKRKLNDDNSSDINVVGDRIYYYKNTKYILDGNTYIVVDDDTGIYSMRTNGSDKQKISDYSADSLNVVGDRIYYSYAVYDNYRIYSISINGSDRRQLNDEDSRAINVAGDRIYYYSRDDDGIYSIRVDGSDRQKLIGDDYDEFSEIINVVGDRIYYGIDFDSDNPIIYSMRIDGSDWQLA